MAKRKARELIKTTTGPETILMSSGVEVTVFPFPSGLWTELNTNALSDPDLADPKPPKKSVKTVTGPEEIDDLNNPEYKAELEQKQLARNELFLEAILDFCVQVEIDESVAKRIEKYSDPLPIDPDERRIEYLIRYVIRTADDYNKIAVSASTQMMISDPEVADRLQSFQSEMERAKSADNGSSGLNQKQRLAVQ